MNTKFIPALILIATTAFAQEIQQVPAAEAGKIARKVTAALGSPTDAPFAVDPDLEKPAGIKASGETGLLALPDKKLKPESLAAAGQDVTPLGHLWMRNIVLAVNNAAPDPAKLRVIGIADNDKEVKVDVYYLGVTKSEAGALDLGIFGKGKDALVKVPLVKTDAAASSTPIALDGHKEGENTGVLVITVFGSYKADVIVTKPQ